MQAPRLFGVSFGVDAVPYYYVCLGLVALLIFVSLRLRDSRVGRAWMALREDETAASAMGVNLVHFKLLAFAIGAGFAGMTGVFFVAKLQTATPDMFNFNVSAMLLVMVVLGGMGNGARGRAGGAASSRYSGRRSTRPGLPQFWVNCPRPGPCDSPYLQTVPSSSPLSS